MPFRKRESIILNEATTRSAGLLAIDASGALDLGNGDTHPAFQGQIKATAAALEAYNKALAIADGLGNQLKAEEKKLRRLSTRMLTGVKLKHGEDSDEYEKAGGTRESERKRPARPAKAKL